MIVQLDWVAGFFFGIMGNGVIEKKEIIESILA